MSPRQPRPRDRRGWGGDHTARRLLGGHTRPFAAPGEDAGRDEAACDADPEDEEVVEGRLRAGDEVPWVRSAPGPGTRGGTRGPGGAPPAYVELAPAESWEPITRGTLGHVSSGVQGVATALSHRSLRTRPSGISRSTYSSRVSGECWHRLGPGAVLRDFGRSVALDVCTTTIRSEANTITPAAAAAPHQHPNRLDSGPAGPPTRARATRRLAARPSDLAGEGCPSTGSCSRSRTG